MPVVSSTKENAYNEAGLLLKAPILKPSGGIKAKLSGAAGVAAIALNDLLVLGISLGLAYLTRIYLLPYIYVGFHSPVRQEMLVSLWWYPFLCAGVLAYEGLYHRRYPFWREVKFVIKAITWTTFLAVLLIFLSKSADSTSRTLVVLTYVYAVFLLPVGRLLIKRFIVKLGIWRKPVLILGTGKTAKLVSKGFAREVTMGYRPVGLLEDNLPKKRGVISEHGLIPVLGKLSDIKEVMNRTGVRDIVIASPGLDKRQLVDLTGRLQQVPANVMLVPDISGIPLTGIKVNYFFDEKTLFLSMRNNLSSSWNRFLKRVFDLVAGSMMLLVVLPVMLLIVLAIKVDSRGPVVFAHRRIGQHGKSFNCLKFRTMVVNSQEVLDKLLDSDPKIREEWQREFKLKNDPRITRVGKFLRKTSLDELPQIFNVLAGQMSLVGPRPIIDKEIEKYNQYFDYYKMVPPGITGLWQVSGRNDIDYEERVQLDVWYVRNWSLWLDITMLFKTIAVVLSKKGAY